MYVIKRSGEHAPVQFDKITSRIYKLCYGLNPQYCDPALVAQKVVMGIYPGVTTSQLDELAAETAAYLSTQHPDYSVLAARIAVSNLHKNTEKSFSATVFKLRNHIHPRTGEPAPLIAEDVADIVARNATKLDNAIIYDRDFTFDYFGFKTLERSYLLKLDGVIAERPQHMLMRVAIGIHKEDIDSAIETYNLMSQKYFTHATPTLYNAGTPRPQMSSCFLICMKDDSIEGIFDTLKTCACISKFAGGIGLSIHNIRATGSYVAGTNGQSNGIVPMLRVFNDAARYVDQGGGKRKGSFAVYLEPWHADIEEFLELKKNHGKEENRARDLFYAMWIPDLFMKRVEANAEWTLFCPNEARGLQDVYGKEFEDLYESYEKAGKGRKTLKAQELWYQILTSQIETGTPYMLYKDACNMKSNQKNLGTIKSSNLCTEIIEYTAPDEVAVCNLASINLRAFVEDLNPPSSPILQASKAIPSNGNSPIAPGTTSPTNSTSSSSPNNANTFNFANMENYGRETISRFNNKRFNFQALFEVTKAITKNLNRVIDNNYYPVPEAKKSNLRHRPIGIGVQGLADAFIEMRFAFESPEARKLNRDIFETIYFAACTMSCEIAMAEGPYETFKGSPMSQGIFQFDMWNQKPNPDLKWDWDGLKQKVMQYGVRNSLMLAPMPTASTSQILGNNECFEPYTSNIYTRRVLAGEFAIVNKHLLQDLIDLGLWTPEVRNQIIADKGSIQRVKQIPDDLKELYKTVWEIKQRCIIDLAADRGAFIDQSQSLNIHIADATVAKLTSMHFYAWKLGLKTGLYYLRTKPKADAIQFTVDQEALAKSRAVENNNNTTTANNNNNSNEATSSINEPMAKVRIQQQAQNNNSNAFTPSKFLEAPAVLKKPEVTEDDEEGCLMCGS